MLPRGRHGELESNPHLPSAPSPANPHPNPLPPSGEEADALPLLPKGCEVAC